MPEETIPNVGVERILAVLSEIPEIQHAVPDASGARIFLISEQGRPEGMILSSVRKALQATGIDGGGYEFHVSYVAAPNPARRARFIGAEVERPEVGRLVASVMLEWQGVLHTGRAEGEATAAGEIRSCAHATIRALEEVVGGPTGLALVGAKAIRIFDTDLVAVLLHGRDASERGLIGASLVTDSTPKASALAVLNATNRVLGNFLTTAD